RQYILPMLLMMAGLWLFNYINWKTGAKLNKWGIRPRRAKGLIGIPMAPFLHGNFNHLLFNSMPLFVLGLFLLSENPQIFFIATIVITLLAGLGVWLVGRRGIHIGASALIAGYFGFIVVSAYQRPTFTTFFCAGIAMYYFGGILFSLFPTEESVSWEGHLCGFVSGLIAMYLCTYHFEFFTKMQYLF
ncbi:MAG TPA: rhomboid family intramembrane serine protease, partial [Candidatus Berkiella sp.]|nr:rhomboid family intramembrane serine protease [Candidatus Berkiella sp.]